MAVDAAGRRLEPGWRLDTGKGGGGLSAQGVDWAPQRELAEHPSTLICHPEALPLADESLELVLVHHLLEVAPQPTHALREAARVTSDSGRLILIGWHPLGIAGPARLKRCDERFYQRSRWLTPGRLRDWLRFIDFNIERIDYCGFVPFENTPDWLLMEHWGRRHNLPLGRAWIISAKRQMCRMIPLKKRFDPAVMLGSKVSVLACMARELPYEPPYINARPAMPEKVCLNSVNEVHNKKPSSAASPDVMA